MRRKKTYISSNYLIYKSRALNFAFRELQFDTIYNTYLNESPFKYHISILGGLGFQNMGKPAYIILERSLIVDKQIRCSSNLHQKK